jgi:hypothetical protein
MQKQPPRGSRRSGAARLRAARISGICSAHETSLGPPPASFPPGCGPCGAESHCPGRDRPAAGPASVLRSSQAEEKILRTVAAAVGLQAESRSGIGLCSGLASHPGRGRGWPDRDRWRRSSENRVRPQRARARPQRANVHWPRAGVDVAGQKRRADRVAEDPVLIGFGHRRVPRMECASRTLLVSRIRIEGGGSD